jgi:2-polyprenyl-3-methyl-5-hydroxy-6-metoxy-1,4-benzoquinol methylase
MDALESHLRRQIEHSRRFFWHRLRWRLVKRYLPADRPFSLIDVGAGAGILGAFLADELPNAEYRFIEPLDSLERHLGEQYGERANGRELESFEGIDYVTVLDVVEHIEDDREFLADLARKMAPGSLLLLTVPAMPWLWSGWDVALGHYRRYRKRDLRSLAAAMPLEIVELSYVFPEMLPPALVRRLRLPASKATGPADESAEFPDPPALLNQLLYEVGLASQAARKVWPAGTSLYAVLRRT